MENLSKEELIEELTLSRENLDTIWKIHAHQQKVNNKQASQIVDLLDRLEAYNTPWPIKIYNYVRNWIYNKKD